MDTVKPLDPKFDPHKVRPKKSTKIKKMIAVMSGKGGVGKSTISALIASHAQKLGHQAAIIDGDIIGPSIGHLFNIHQPAYGDANGIQPAISERGVKIMTSNMLVKSETTPILWRGALVTNAIKDFYGQVLWDEIDLMVLDMPPGTGDVALTMFQSLNVDGIVIVTSPQDLVSMIVSKAVEMAQQLKIPILGIIENYSYFVCDQCEALHHPFGESKLEALAEKYGLKLLAQLPIDPEINTLGDLGQIEDVEHEVFTTLVQSLMESSDV
jgi:Mrp family chromosome partitioning ATPase